MMFLPIAGLPLSLYPELYLSLLLQWSDAEQQEEEEEEEEVEEDVYCDDFDDDGGEFDSS